MNTKHLELQPMQPKQPGTMDLYRALLRMRANGWTVGKHFAKPAPQRRPAGSR